MRYLSEQNVIDFNSYLIKKDSPKEQILTKEPASLSAILEGMKQEFFEMEAYPSIEEKASFLFVGLILKHIFGNANKRTAVMSLIIFLKVNGYLIMATDDELFDKTVSIAENHDENTLKETSIWIKDKIKRA
ncbi:MAG: type II toxin-antitoxin system death-on-curing family toxin [Streptococcaceae bacterium]|jgi:death-on-curing protein|nr:type II toxin-antitoxin system death-on-curing family toxin [Streptococcaceae bacterium]